MSFQNWNNKTQYFYNFCSANNIRQVSSSSVVHIRNST